jgi:hypothetical protein
LSRIENEIREVIVRSGYFRLLLTVIVGIQCLACVVVAVAEEAIRFDDFFEDGVLRVDVIHSGTRDEQQISVRRMLREPVWGGPRVSAPPYDRGAYRLDVLDERTGELVYRHGFSSLYREWTTTDEARTVRRAFEETLDMP